MTAKKKIVILSLVPYKIFPARVGGQKGIAVFNEYLAEEAELICITVRSNLPGYAKKYKVLNVLTDNRFRYINLFSFFTIRKLIRQSGATHLLIEHPYFGWLGILLKKFTGIRLIIHSHNIEATRWKSLNKWWWKILWWYERVSHQFADYNLFIQDDDREYAIKNYRLQSSKCITVSYGIEWSRKIPDEELIQAKHQLRKLHHISEKETVLLFNGAFNYQPNVNALLKILSPINQLLQQKQGFMFRIIICGKDIPLHISKSPDANIIIAGFVDDITLYFKGADIFLNPVVEGGGIKTKLVEALGYNMNAVSTKNGAIGIDPSWCNGKLLIAEDNDWDHFTNLVIKARDIDSDTPPVYFEHFYWGHSIKRLLEFISR